MTEPNTTPVQPATAGDAQLQSGEPLAQAGELFVPATPMKENEATNGNISAH